MDDPVLSIELVPKSQWYNNLRLRVGVTRWDELRHETYQRAGYHCQVCDAQSDTLHAHEIWRYDAGTHTQILEGLIALCPACHEVKHIGLARKQGHYDRALSYLMKINDWTWNAADVYVREQFKIWEERNKYTWKLDVSIVLS